jgi:hypothetical protein
VSESLDANAPVVSHEAQQPEVDGSLPLSPADELRRRRAYRRRPIQVAVLATVVAITAIIVAIVSSKPDAKRSGEVLAAPAGADGRTTYKAAHFVARFPSTPSEYEVPGSVGAAHFMLPVAVVRTPQIVVVAENDIKPALPQSAVDANLHTTLSSFAVTSGMTLKSQDVTTFRGHSARRGSFTNPAGAAFTAIAVVYGGSREYVLLAPAGDAFDNLVASFEVLP